MEIKETFFFLFHKQSLIISDIFYVRMKLNRHSLERGTWYINYSKQIYALKLMFNFVINKR